MYIVSAVGAVQNGIQTHLISLGEPLYSDVLEGELSVLPEPLFKCVKLGLPGVLYTLGVSAILGRSVGGRGAGPGFRNWSGL